MRCFIAIDIDDNLRTGIAELQRDLQDKIHLRKGRLKWVRPELMHLTLKFLGEVEEERLPQLSRAVASAAAGHKGFSFAAPVLGCFGNPVKVIWLGTDEENTLLLQLHRDIEDALDRTGWPREQRTFSPHLTLGRIKDGSRDRSLKDVIKNYGPMQLGTLNVDSVLVYESQLTPTGPIYTVLSKHKLE